jgi:uncharacterized repeat protein (TIGR01451 family)
MSMDRERHGVIRNRAAASAWRGALTWSAGLLLSASSCALPGRWDGAAARHEPPAVEAREQGSARFTPTLDRTVEHAIVSDRAAQQGIIQPLSHTEEALEDGPALAGFTGAKAPVAPISHPAEPRVAVNHPCPPVYPPYGAMYCPDGACGGPVESGPYPEEVLCDGGDRALPFHYEAYGVGGLETEDTVAEFVDHEGRRHVRPSTRACVYAPKFAAVRTISQPVTDYSINKLSGAHVGVGLAGLDRGESLDVQQQTDQLSAVRMRERASGIGADAGDRDLHQVYAADQHLKIQNTYEDRAFSGGAEHGQTSEAYLASAVQRAIAWSRDQNPVIVAKDHYGHQVLASFRAHDYTGVEDRRTPGDLKIIKLADKSTAKPGDTLTFTIRFENRGGRELSDVRIMDHLSPRLEYVPQSAITELDGRLTLEEQSDGSQVLTFELEQPLAGGATGEITFRCVVR